MPGDRIDAGARDSWRTRRLVRPWHGCLGDRATADAWMCQMMWPAASRQRPVAGPDNQCDAACSAARRPADTKKSPSIHCHQILTSDILRARFLQVRQNWSIKDQRRRCASTMPWRNWCDGEISLAPICPDDFGSASYISSPP
jgi:hypothetical protein